MKIIGIIPARLASSRLPGKMLLDLGGKTLIQRTWEQVGKAKSLAEIIIATDHHDIAIEAERFGAKVVLTSPDHQSGTDRCHEAISKLDLNTDFVINIQGDEPFVSPEDIDNLAGVLVSVTELATLIQKISSPSDIDNPNVVKVVKDMNGKALYFSRAGIPFRRDSNAEIPTYWRHIGMYAYRMDILQKIASLPPSSYEKAESLEQLRWLENGLTIQTAEAIHTHFGIDTVDDLEKARQYLKTLP
jgi:3-deoxy-manno-octulosonate cytidylyltransferase (CMP-KDO synthetase)